MEDRHTVITDFQLPGGGGGPPRQFAAVYDGHSCYKGSEHASRRLHEIIAEQPAVQECTVGGCACCATAWQLQNGCRVAVESCCWPARGLS
jgi:serine/threonine protein phosphatase PrpC